MKRKSITRFPLLLLGGIAWLTFASFRCHSAVLLKYEMTTNSPTWQDPVSTLEGGPLLFGSGVGTTFLPSSTSNYTSHPVCTVRPAGSALPLANADAALAANCFVYFDFRVGAGVATLDLQQMTLDIARGGDNTNRGYGVFITTPTIVDVAVQPSKYILTQRPVWDPQTIDLSGIASLQGLKAGDVVRVKIPFWTTSDALSVDMDNITLLGNVQTNQATADYTGVLPIVITDVQRQAETVSLTWNSQTGKVYAVEYSVDLLSWDTFVTNIPAGPGTNTTINLGTTDPNAGGDFVLLQYQMGQFGPQIQDAVRTAAGGDLAPGSGLVLSVNFGGYTSSPALNANFVAKTTNVSAALANGSVFTFDLTVGTNVTDLDITSLSLNGARGGSSTPRGYGVYVTTPTTSNELAVAADNLNAVRPNWESKSNNLSGVSSLQKLTAGQVVRFTVPLYSPAVNNTVEMDDLTVRGAVSPRPVPAYVGGEQLYLRVRCEPIPVESAKTPSSSWRWYPTRTLEQLPSSLSVARDGTTSIYGGWKSFRTNATGFLYPLKINDRWWLVDPQGYLFLHKGVASISAINSTGAVAALQTKFGSSSNWVVATTTLLRQNGFNGAGAWSDTTRLKQVPGPLVYTVKVSFLANHSGTNESPSSGYPQVFDPTFVTDCQTYAQQFAGAKDDPFLLGYFSDNELDFPSSMLDTWLGLSPTNNSSYEEAWRWLRERYGAGAAVGQVTTQDRYDFLGHVWGRYYSVVNQAIKLTDTNHLYLGSRLYGGDKDRPEIFRAIGNHVDVIAVNHYGQWTPDIDRIRMWERESGRPVIITEFYVKGEDSGMPNNTGAGWVVRTQNDRGFFYQNFVLALLESKVCVGWHWFKYADNDPDAIGADPSNIDSNKGVVSNRYDPYFDLLDKMQLLNERAYRLTEYFDGTFAP